MVTTPHTQFGSALLLPNIPVPAGVIGPDGKAAPKRFNVYRNNVIVSLSEALAATFPALQRLLGEEYFMALAREFISRHPPTNPVLIWYGAEFGDFIETFPPLADYPYLADVARLEWFWLQAYHAADCVPLAPSSLGELLPDELSAVQFEPHPSASLIESRWPIHSLVMANRFDLASSVKVDLNIGETVLVCRPNLTVLLLSLQKCDALFLKSLLSGNSLGAAAALAGGANADFDLAANLSRLLEVGVFSQLK